jgi:hypothetical protein
MVAPQEAALVAEGHCYDFLPKKHFSERDIGTSNLKTRSVSRSLRGRLTLLVLGFNYAELHSPALEMSG